MKGGNTEALYKLDGAKDGRLLMARSLQRQHPDVVKIVRKWGRWQHHVDYRPFKANKLLRGKDKLKLVGPLADLLGARTWSAHTCDGTLVSVSFHVTPDGAVAFDSAVPTTVKVKTDKHGFRASFAGKAGVSVSLKSKDQLYELKVDGKSGKCGKDKAPKLG